MTSSHRTTCLLAVMFAFGAVASLGSCARTSASPPRDEPLPAIRIAAEPIPFESRLRIDPKRLPLTARADYPSFDGDSFFVAIAPHLTVAQSSTEVFTGLVVPVLRAVGFERRPEELSVPRGAGTRLPSADLASLSAVVCYEVDDPRFQAYQPVCNAMRRGERSEIADRVFLNGDGMTPAQFKADLERPRYEYFFRQAYANVPVEHMGVHAGRWDGETVTLVHGSVLNRFVITNAKRLALPAAVTIALNQLATMKGVGRVERGRQLPGELVLLPYGASRLADGSRVAGVRYAWRTLLFGQVALEVGSPLTRASWLAWIDAQTGKLLELVPQFDSAGSQGLVWRRAPNTPTQVRSATIDSAVGGQFTLQLNDVAPGRFMRLDFLGNGVYTDGEVSIPNAGGGSSASFAQFNQAPINVAVNAVCPAGGNNAFRQVNAYMHLSNFHQLVVSAGSFPLFPESQIEVIVDYSNFSGSWAQYDENGPGQAQILFGGSFGFVEPGCPDLVDEALLGSVDSTIISHEFTHLSNKRLHNRRPADWCGVLPCPMPQGAAMFHDFADVWSNGYSSTPCFSGYTSKNNGGVDASLDCVMHDEMGGLPRLSSVSVPFDPADPQDHFPEHRNFSEADYADGQIASAALWMVRQGMRSKCLPSGTAQFWVRLNRAFWNFGFMPTSCAGCDRDVYRYLQDFALKLTEQWATAGQPGGPPAFHHNGAHTTSKVTSGFAKAGMFLLPFQCIDGDAATGDAAFCPVAGGGENGGDAVVDVDDNDATDDTNIDGVVNREVDYLRRTGVAPTFQAWTGPRYKFNAAGNARAFTASVATPAICNTQFQVELASDDTFTTNPVVSGWQNVSTTVAPECYGTWTPSSADWDSLKGAAGHVKIYYRLRTRDAVDANEKISTSPGNGLFTVPPAYVIANDSGTP